MNKKIALALLGLALPLSAQAVEFRTPGTALGIGGAGVARNNGGLTSYWNPAAGAFKDSPFAVGAGVGAGLKINNGLAENVDNLSKLDFDDITKFNNSVDDVGNFTKAVTIMDDISKSGGNIGITGQVPIGVSINQFSFGIYGNMSGYIMPIADITNIVPTANAGGANITVNDLNTSLGANTYTPSGYFTTAQLAALSAAITANQTGALPAGAADNLANAIDNQLKESGIPADQALATLTTTALPVLNAASANTFNQNTTSVLTKAIQYVEIPVSYGHPIKLGKKSTLGVGITGKVISGTVYQSQVLLVNNNNVDASDIIEDIDTNKKTSSAFGIDLGLLYKYDKWLNVGLVAKNINSPEFDAPDYNAPKYDTISGQVLINDLKKGDAVKLKPQVRAGVSADVLPIVNVSADLDITENETVAPSVVGLTAPKSQNLGGGVEVHPASWLKIRGGAYKNLSASKGGTVLTAGFKIFMLDVDGAFATDTMEFDGNEIPQEAQVNASLNFSF